METKLFNQWDTSSVVVKDLGLRNYVNLSGQIAPYSFGRSSNKKFGKSSVHLIERVANDMLTTGHLQDNRTHKRVSGRDTGKKQRIYRIIKESLGIIEARTKQNPVQALVQAIENTAPREATTRIRQGGIIVHKAVDVAPSRRLDNSLKFLTHGAGQRSFKKSTSLAAAFADEVIAAMNNDNKCYSISRRDELERIAASAR